MYFTVRKKKPAPLPPSSHTKMSALPEEKTQTLKSNKVMSFDMEEEMKQKSATLPSSFPSPPVHRRDVELPPSSSPTPPTGMSSSDEDTVVDFPVDHFNFTYEDRFTSGLISPDSQKLLDDIIPPTSEIVAIKSPKREIQRGENSGLQFNTFKQIQKSSSENHLNLDTSTGLYESRSRSRSPSRDRSPLLKLKQVKCPQIDPTRIPSPMNGHRISKSQSSLGFHEKSARGNSDNNEVLQFSKIPPVFLFGNNPGLPDIIVDDVDLGLDVSNKNVEQFNFFEPPPPYLSNFNRTESNESWTGFLSKLETILSNKTEEYV